MWLTFSCSGEVRTCVMMQLAHVSLVCLAFAAGFLSTEGKSILHVLKCCLNTTG